MVEEVVVDVQLALDEGVSVYIPEYEQIQQWASAAFDAVYILRKQEKIKQVQITVRIVEELEICQLNKSYRQKNGATNVLSFPFMPPPGIPDDEVFNSLGDLVICATVVNREANEQQKEYITHWAHMIVHGTLHLLGYDHQSIKEACEMESLETEIMSRIGYPDPYKEV